MIDHAKPGLARHRIGRDAEQERSVALVLPLVVVPLVVVPLAVFPLAVRPTLLRRRWRCRLAVRPALFRWLWRFRRLRCLRWLRRFRWVGRFSWIGRRAGDPCVAKGIRIYIGARRRRDVDAGRHALPREPAPDV